jgi:hypothetical protein
VRDTAALIRSMLVLRNEHRSGVLTVFTEEGVKTFVYLRDGVPVFAEEGTHGETLGRLLVRQRILTQQQYAAIIGKMTDALVLNEQLRFGEVAVELGFLSEEQVKKALVDQVRWKIVRVFQRPGVRWEYEDSLSRLDGIPTFPMRIEALVLDAVRWIDDEQKNELAISAALDHTPHVAVGDIPALVRNFDLTREEAPFLSTLDGKRTVAAALETKLAADVDAPAILAALLVTRAVQTSAEPRLARPATPIIEIRLQAGPRQVSTPNPPHADVPSPPHADAPKAPAQTPPRTPIARPNVTRTSAILQALESSRVKPDAQRTPATEHEAKLLAERAFQDALVDFNAGRYAQAVPEFTRASQLLPQSDEYKLYARWCSARASSDGLPHAAARGELRRLALAAVKTDPNSAFGHYVAGSLAHDEGEDVHAYRFLARAVKLDPSLLDAQRQLRIVERRVKVKPGG